MAPTSKTGTSSGTAPGKKGAAAPVAHRNHNRLVKVIAPVAVFAVAAAAITTSAVLSGRSSTHPQHHAVPAKPLATVLPKNTSMVVAVQAGTPAAPNGYRTALLNYVTTAQPTQEPVVGSRMSTWGGPTLASVTVSAANGRYVPVLAAQIADEAAYRKAATAKDGFADRAVTRGGWAFITANPKDLSLLRAAGFAGPSFPSVAQTKTAPGFFWHDLDPKVNVTSGWNPGYNPDSLIVASLLGQEGPQAYHKGLVQVGVAELQAQSRLVFRTRFLVGGKPAPKTSWPSMNKAVTALLVSNGLQNRVARIQEPPRQIDQVFGDPNSKPSVSINDASRRFAYLGTMLASGSLYVASPKDSTGTAQDQSWCPTGKPVQLVVCAGSTGIGLAYSLNVQSYLDVLATNKRLAVSPTAPAPTTPAPTTPAPTPTPSSAPAGSKTPAPSGTSVASSSSAAPSPTSTVVHGTVSAPPSTLGGKVQQTIVPGSSGSASPGPQRGEDKSVLDGVSWQYLGGEAIITIAFHRA